MPATKHQSWKRKTHPSVIVKTKPQTTWRHVSQRALPSLHSPLPKENLAWVSQWWVDAVFDAVVRCWVAILTRAESCRVWLLLEQSGMHYFEDICTLATELTATIVETASQETTPSKGGIGSSLCTPCTACCLRHLWWGPHSCWQQTSAWGKRLNVTFTYWLVASIWEYIISMKTYIWRLHAITHLQLHGPERWINNMNKFNKSMMDVTSKDLVRIHEESTGRCVCSKNVDAG